MSLPTPSTSNTAPPPLNAYISLLSQDTPPPTYRTSDRGFPVECIIEHEDYILRSYLANPGRRTSTIWEEHIGKEICLDSGHDVRWLCIECQQKGTVKSFNSLSTSDAGRHMKKKHGYKMANDRLIKPDQLATTSVLDMVTNPKRRRANTAAEELLFKQRLIEWVAVCHVAFLIIEHQTFRQLIEAINPDFTLPLSADTIRNWTLAAFSEQKLVRQRQLLSAKSLINFTFDCWTSRNYRAVFAVTAHFINKDYQRQDILIGLRELLGPHSGENIGELLQEILQDWGLAGRIGYFTCDNVDENDKAIQKALQIATYLEDNEVRHRRLRCFGHVVNLAAKAFLFGKDPDAYENDESPTIKDEEELITQFRKKGAPGKAHNTVHYIRKTPSRRRLFEKYVLKDYQELGHVERRILIPRQDNDTRWNSWANMFDDLVLLYRPINDYSFRAVLKPKDQNPLSHDDLLTADDWHDLTHWLEALKPIQKATLKLQGNAC